jgi:hypothetical protein
MGDKWSSSYKKWLESLDEPAPEGVWNSISNSLDIDDTWVRISEELDLDDVWQNIEFQLPAQNILHVPASHVRSKNSYWLAAMLMLLMLFITNDEPLKMYSAVDSVIADKRVTDSRVPDQNDALTDTLKRDVVESMPFVTDRLPGKKHIIADRLSNQERKAAGKVHDKHTMAKQPMLPVWPFSELPIQASIVVSVPNYDQATVSTDSTITSILIDQGAAVKAREKDAVSEEALRPARWRFGIIGSISNTWLLNNETTNGLKRSSLNSTIATFGKELGVSLDNRIGNRSFLRAEYYFNTETGQRYREYVNALYQEKTIQLRYQKLQLAYSWSVMRRPSLFQPCVFGGVYASKLKVADLTIGSENGSVTQEYNPWDFGVLFGIESEFQLNHKVVVVPGLRTSYGLQNVFEGTSQSPSYFNKTRTAAISFSLAIKYQY